MKRYAHLVNRKPEKFPITVQEDSMMVSHVPREPLPSFLYKVFSGPTIYMAYGSRFHIHFLLPGPGADIDMGKNKTFH